MFIRSAGFAGLLLVGALMLVGDELKAGGLGKYLVRVYWRYVLVLALISWANLTAWLLVLSRYMRRSATGSKVGAVGRDLIVRMERHELGD
jgi:hypothetical protein